jgi:carbon storage regulator CsrA
LRAPPGVFIPWEKPRAGDGFPSLGHPEEEGIPVLVLTRRLDQSFVLPGLGVTVRVLEVRGQSVRLGIVAPADVVILRKELVPEAGLRPQPSRV